MGRVEGFGLLELLTGTAIALTVLGIASSALGGMVGSVRLAGAAERLAAALRTARSEALARGRRVEFRFDPPRGTWSMREDGGPVLDVTRLPTGVVFASVPRTLRLRFTTVGTADNGSIVLAAGARTRSVIVNQRGRVRVL